MRMELAFGRTGLAVDLPPGPEYHVLEARSAQALPNEADAIEAALDRPTAGPPLADLARGKRSAAISVCDITRPAPNRRTLPPVLRRLHDAGMGADAIRICIATGLHRPATGAELNEILGEEIAARYPVVNHNARDEAAHRFLGTTRRGTPVSVDDAFVSADLHITLGFIEPHLMLGFSGGRKLIAPGLAYQETIQTIHSPRFMREPRSIEGSYEDNPLHHELLEVARMVRHDFMLDVALTRERRIAGVFAGEPETAHRAGVSFVSQALLERLEQPVDAAITSAAGYPLDMTFYQAIKGITAAAHIVRPGGSVLLAAACDEGAGAAEFQEMLTRCSSASEFLHLIERAPVVVDQWQLEKLALVMRDKQVLFYVPGLPREHQSRLWGPAFDSLPEALDALMARLGPRPAVAVLPEGPYVLAKVEETALMV